MIAQAVSAHPLDKYPPEVLPVTYCTARWGWGAGSARSGTWSSRPQTAITRDASPPTCLGRRGRPSASALRPSMKSSVWKSAKLLIEPGERRRFGLVDREVSGLQRGLDAERPARGDLLGQPDPRFQRLGRGGGDLLDHAHPIGLLRAPVVAGEHVAHGVPPSRFPRESDGRAAAREPSVRVLVLAKPHVGAGHPDVGHQMQFVAHVPGIAMDNHDQELAELLGPSKRRSSGREEEVERTGEFAIEIQERGDVVTARPFEPHHRIVD